MVEWVTWTLQYVCVLGWLSNEHQGGGQANPGREDRRNLPRYHSHRGWWNHCDRAAAQWDVRGQTSRLRSHGFHYGRDWPLPHATMVLYFYPVTFCSLQNTMHGPEAVRIMREELQYRGFIIGIGIIVFCFSFLIWKQSSLSFLLFLLDNILMCKSQE